MLNLPTKHGYRDYTHGEDDINEVDMCIMTT